MIPDFPHNIRMRWLDWNFIFLRPDVALSLPYWVAKLRQPIESFLPRFSCGIYYFLNFQSLRYLQWAEKMSYDNLRKTLAPLWGPYKSHHNADDLVFLFSDITKWRTRLITFLFCNWSQLWFHCYKYCGTMELMSFWSRISIFI